MTLQYVASPVSAEPAQCPIVHLGLGAFMRAHLAVYQERLNQLEGRPCGIRAANIRSNRDLTTALALAGHRYHVAEWRDAGEGKLREVRSITSTLFAGAGESAKLLEWLADPVTEIVTLTVTEKGYFYNPGERSLKWSTPEITYDLQFPEAPRTAIGILVAALARRRRAGAGPLSIVSLDNMPSNGHALREAVLQLAARRGGGLAEWIEAHAAFPCSMVDRIVPAVTETALAPVQAALVGRGERADSNALTCEAFSQWVIEDRFLTPRPAWEKVGAELVADVEAHEAMKLRMLNGSHSLLAYSGCLAEIATVADAVAEPLFAALIERYMQAEAAPTLAAKLDTDAYRTALLQRFRNQSLAHRLEQIAMDGSQKIPQRWLSGARARLQAGVLPHITALGLAAWAQFLQAGGPRVNDPEAADLTARLAAAATPVDKIKALLNTPALAAGDLADNAAWLRATADYFEQIEQQGIRAAAKSALAQ